MMPRFGRANLLAAFALFDDNPSRINTILAELDRVTVEDVKAAAGRWFVPSNQTSIDSRPAAKATNGASDARAHAGDKGPAIVRRQYSLGALRAPRPLPNRSDSGRTLSQGGVR